MGRTHNCDLPIESFAAKAIFRPSGEMTCVDRGAEAVHERFVAQILWSKARTVLAVRDGRGLAQKFAQHAGAGSTDQLIPAAHGAEHDTSGGGTKSTFSICMGSIMP